MIGFNRRILRFYIGNKTKSTEIDSYGDMIRTDRGKDRSVLIDDRPLSYEIINIMFYATVLATNAI